MVIKSENMKVIKQFYTHKESKTYYIGDEYNGVKFKGFENYIEQPKKKVLKKKK